MRTPLATRTARAIPMTALATALALAGCGSGGGEAPEQVTCAWFAGPNCWRDTVAATVACSDAAATGTFDAGTTSCTYGDGVSVSFATPAAASAVQDGPPWRFTVRAPGGAACASLVETSSTLSVTTSLGVFVESASASSLDVTCPDGTRVRTSITEALGATLLGAPLQGSWPPAT